MNTSVISEVASATEPAGASEEALPEVSSSRSAQREARAIRLAELDAAKIGVGVSRYVVCEVALHAAFHEPQHGVCCVSALSSLCSGVAFQTGAAGIRQYIEDPALPLGGEDDRGFGRGTEEGKCQIRMCSA